MDNILQGGAWLTDDPEHEYSRIALGLRAFDVNAELTIFCKLKLGSRHHHIVAIAKQGVAIIVHWQGRHGVLSLGDVQVYLQNFVHLLYLHTPHTEGPVLGNPIDTGIVS